MLSNTIYLPGVKIRRFLMSVVLIFHTVTCRCRSWIDLHCLPRGSGYYACRSTLVHIVLLHALSSRLQHSGVCCEIFSTLISFWTSRYNPQKFSLLKLSKYKKRVFRLSLLQWCTVVQFSAAEGVCTAIMDEFPQILRVGQRPTILRAVYCITSFLLALPMVTEVGQGHHSMYD